MFACFIVLHILPLFPCIYIVFFLNENGPVKVEFLLETRDVNRLTCVRS